MLFINLFNQIEYKWKSTRQRLLEELGEIFGCDNTALLKKIKNLRDQYRSERKTVRERDDNYVSRWRFYEPLSFLDSVIDPLPTATTANVQYFHNKIVQMLLLFFVFSTHTR